VSPLLVIWLVAILLSVGAVAWMTVLIILRLLHERRTARRAHDRRAVEAALIGVVQDRPDALTKLAPFIHRGRLMAEVLLEFLGLVSPRSSQRFASLASNGRFVSAPSKVPAKGVWPPRRRSGRSRDRRASSPCSAPPGGGRRTRGSAPCARCSRLAERSASSA
jgi:hypothetical protein